MRRRSLLSDQSISVLFVCLGNICRSPTAHGVFEKLVENRGLSHLFHIDSAGTSAWHEGAAPDSRSTVHAKKRGYMLNHLCARQVTIHDFTHFDYILAMDNENLANLQRIQPVNSQAELSLFLHYSAQTKYVEVPDPYSGGACGFELVLDLIEQTCENLLDTLLEENNLSKITQS